ncbi:MAG: hypothetical protein E6I44_15695, partial [Chloroflexi bacterium]
MTRLADLRGEATFSSPGLAWSALALGVGALGVGLFLLIRCCMGMPCGRSAGGLLPRDSMIGYQVQLGRLPTDHTDMMASSRVQRVSQAGQHRFCPQTRKLFMDRLGRLLVCLSWVIGFAIIPSTAYSAGDAQDITGAVVPILSLSDPFGSSGEFDADGRLSSRGEFRFRVRVRNRSGDVIEGDSLIVVVQSVASPNYLHDVLNELDYAGTGGKTREGKPFYRVPLGGKS